MIRLSTLIWPLIIGLVAFTLFQVKYKVSKLSNELAGVRQQISVVESNTEVLKAEWAHLNTPAYIRELTDKYLAGEGIAKAHIGSIHEIPMRTATMTGKNDLFSDQSVISETEAPVNDLVAPATTELEAVNGSLRKQYNIDEIGNLVDQLQGTGQ